MLTFDPTWYAEMSRSGVRPIYLVDLELGPMAYLDVLDWTLIGGSDTITITTDLGALTVTNGIDWSASASNTATATSIATLAYNTNAAGVFATSSNNHIYFWSSDIGVNTITITTSNSSAAFLIPSNVQRTISFTNSTALIAGFISSLASVNSISNRLDILTRVVTIGQLELEFVDDGLLRDFLRRSRPKGKRVTVRIGCPAITVANYAPVGVYVIEDFVPEPGKVILRCAEPSAHVLDAILTGHFFNMHPLSAISSVLTAVGFPASLLNSTSLDRSQAQYSTVSHFGTSRHNYHGAPPSDSRISARTGVTINGHTVFDGTLPDGSAFNNGITKWTKALDVINELTASIYGSFGPDENGLYSFSVYNQAAASVRNITDDDIDVLTQESTAANVINLVSYSGVASTSTTGGGDPNQNRPSLFVNEDRNSSESMGMSGLSRSTAKTISSDWLGTPSFLIANFLSTDTTLYVSDPCQAGFSGTRPSTNWYGATSGGAPIQYSWDQLNAGAGRTAYLMITNGLQSEVVQATAFSYPFFTGSATNDSVNIRNIPIQAQAALSPAGAYMDPTLAWLGGATINTSTRVVAMPAFGLYTVPNDASHRGLFGTVSISWRLLPLAGSGVQDEFDGTIRVYDITMFVYSSNILLNRFSFGAPIVKVSLPLRHWDLQIRDFVTLSNDLYLGFQKDGADGNTVFEIIAKELRILDDSPGIELTLAWVRDDVAPPVFNTYPVAITVSVAPVSIVPGDVVTTSALVNVTTINGANLTRS